MKKLLITGSSGLVGSEAVRYFLEQGWEVFGIDNGMRHKLFMSAEEPRPFRHAHYRLANVDIREIIGVTAIVRDFQPDAIIHAAAQPSHDYAASEPFRDFQINAFATLLLLDTCRQYCPQSPFVFLSTNKVYGDGINVLSFSETETRYDLPLAYTGIHEGHWTDGVMHSLFGCSKLAADMYVQEYGRYFDMPTCCLRCGCITGPQHAGVEQHGFLSYLMKCHVHEKRYTVYGYKGKQVRDNIHALDVVRFAEQFILAPRPAEVYNIGGGRENSCSILEAFGMAERLSGHPMAWDYVDTPRKGDHICYITDLTKARTHYPNWNISKDLPTIFQELYDHELERRARSNRGVTEGETAVATPLSRHGGDLAVAAWNTCSTALSRRCLLTKSIWKSARSKAGRSKRRRSATRRRRSWPAIQAVNTRRS